MTAVDRPNMNAGYGIATGADGTVSWDWAAERLTASRNYWIGTTRADGRPHAMPVWGLWLDEAIYFSTDPDSWKARNIAARPDAVIHLESGEEMVVAEGRIDRVAGAELAGSFVAAYQAKYGHEVDTANPSFGFYRMRPSRVLAWREQDFPTSATRFTF
jgi:pyridoxine/pyridoxamine 5'-phosphate oxidase